MYITLLPHRSIFRITGDDKQHFLQGLLTRNLKELTEHSPIYALMLTPQGKFLYDFFILEQHNAYYIDCYHPLKQEILQKFSMYRLRSHVQLEDLPHLKVYALWQEHPTTSSAPDNADAMVYRDPRNNQAGYRWITDNTPQSPLLNTASLIDYDHWRITLTLPDAREDMPSGEIFPLHYQLDKLHAIDFDKGCYVGQEVTTRSKHRGNIRKNLYTVHAPHSNHLPTLGTAITTLDGIRCGELRSCVGSHGLAILECASAHLPLKVDNVMLTVIHHPTTPTTTEI